MTTKDEQFAERARENARRSAIAQGFTEHVTDLDAIRQLRVLLRTTIE